MRLLVTVSGLVLCLAAALVPLPWSVVEPARLLPAAAVVDVRISEQFTADAGVQPAAVAGTFLGVHEVSGASLARMVAAGFSRGRHVVRERAGGGSPLQRPEVVAAVLGLGVSPGRLEDTAVPVDVRLGRGLDPSSLGLLLHVFDATSQRDVARGRRVLGVGAVSDDQTLTCPARPTESVTAARREGVDVVVVPAACGLPAADDVIVAASFVEAVDALLSVE